MGQDPRRGEARAVTVSGILAALGKALRGSPWDVVARTLWCRRQRRHLGTPGHPVVWVRGDAVRWAEWGRRHGYFEVQRMDGLAYLRALGAPIV